MGYRPAPTSPVLVLKIPRSPPPCPSTPPGAWPSLGFEDRGLRHSGLPAPWTGGELSSRRFCGSEGHSVSTVGADRTKALIFAETNVIKRKRCVTEPALRVDYLVIASWRGTSFIFTCTGCYDSHHTDEENEAQSGDNTGSSPHLRCRENSHLPQEGAGQGSESRAATSYLPAACLMEQVRHGPFSLSP